MSENREPICPECVTDNPADALDRRHFIRVAGGGAAALSLGTALPTIAADAVKKPVEKKERPSEALIKELFAGLSAEQKKKVVFPFSSKARVGWYNSAQSTSIGKVYTAVQTEMVERIVKGLCSGEEGWRQIQRDEGKKKWDASGSFANCGADIFGDPLTGKYAFLFSGHHLTIRCDGDSEESTAFGGPIYYGHTPNGNSTRNIFNYQTKEVLKVYDALSEKQRKDAIIDFPDEGNKALQFKQTGGLAFSGMTKDQKELVEKVMRTLLSPFRKEDGDEVMQLIKSNGGMEKIVLGFFKKEGTEEGKWDYWRLEGPGFVWNFRVLPHVHTHVNIKGKLS